MNAVVAPELDVALPGDLTAPSAGAGARLYVYISGQNKTPQLLRNWSVTFTHEGSNWTGTINSHDPHKTLQTPKLSGLFKVAVRGEVGPRPLVGPIKPKPPSTDVVGCNQNCTSFVGIVVGPDGLTATYWTVWDAVCSMA